MESLSVNDIKKVIPHRYPFLLIDRVTEVKDGEYIKGYKNITVNEELFLGHFPEDPVFPGVLIIEAMAQLGAYLILRFFPEDNRLAYFAGLEKVRWKRPVVPGDRLDMVVRIARDRGTFVVMEGEASVDEEIAATATMMAAIAKK